MSRWYNWEQGNFEIQLRALQGKVNFYLNFVGETNFEQNAFTGIPLSENDSIWYAELDSSLPLNRSADATIFRFDTRYQPLFCYNCWYYVTAVVEDPGEIVYRTFVRRLQDVGNDIQLMTLSGPT